LAGVLKKLVIGLAIILLLLVIGFFAFGRYFMPAEISQMMEDAKEFETAHPEALLTKNGVHAAVTGPENAPATFILVHGSPGDWRAWAPYLLDEKLTSKYRVIAVDRAGYGGTEPGKVVGSFSEQAKRLAGWAEGAPGKKIWVGHSFGVPIMVQLAIDRPELVDGMIFVAGAMDPNLERKKWYHRAGDSWLGRTLLPSDWNVANQESIAFEAEMERQAGQLGFVNGPVTIVHAKDDNLADYRHVDFMLKHLTGTKPKVVTLEKGDHFIVWNDVSAIEAAMLQMAGSPTTPTQ